MNFFPSRTFRCLFLLLFLLPAFDLCAQQSHQTGTSTQQKQKTDKRSDSQKSYVHPRTRDAHRNSGGNNQVARPTDRKTGREVVTEKRTPVNK